MRDDAPRRRIVVTADDFGLERRYNEPIVEAHNRGWVTSAAVVVNGAAYAEALALARRTPSLELGVHLDLVAGAPLSAPRDVASLVGSDGRFVGVWRLVERYVAGRLRVAEVEREWEKQIARASDDGIEPAHLSAHFHVHMLPRLFTIAAKLARRAGIRFVRVTNEAPWSTPRAPLRNAGTVLGLWLLARRAQRTLDREGLAPAVACRGLGHSARLGPDQWRALAGASSAAVTEIVCHPGQAPVEDGALADAALLDELRARVTLSSFRDLS